MEEKFKIVSKFSPCGDQPQAIEELVEGLNDGLRTQVLLGVTGSGKTFTMANIIERVQRPALVIAHNKTLAAQLCNEFREFFPHNRVEFFVSYYDYFQPEAYIPRSDTYIEKDLAINDEIDKLRHSATASLCERRDTIVVASVSCIYGLGAPKEYYSQAVSLREGETYDRDELIDKLIAIQYRRSDDFVRSTFRVKGDVVDVYPASNTDIAIRIEFFGDEIERISQIDALTAKPLSELKHVMIFPASHYVVGGDKEEILKTILKDKAERVKYFEEHNKLIEAQRIDERVNYDVEMIREIGYCSGIENYSRYFDGRAIGQPPYTLMDFFDKDFVCFIDESHMTIPQIRAMYNGDKSRKTNLVDYGFRLPAAYDNRPLTFEEFDKKITQLICVSATPAEYELSQADKVTEQLIRPTGLVDPPIEIRPTKNQIDDLISEINTSVATGGRVLVTTLTKKMAESLTEYLREAGIKVKYMHSDIDTLERIEIVKGLRLGEFDTLVGINLLREGLDIPEVKLVAILDADKEGFLRSETSLVQTVGRAARNSESRVILYADTVTGSMQRAIDETNRRRKKQTEYNELNHITPKTVVKPITNTLNITKAKTSKKMSVADIKSEIERLSHKMRQAADILDFEAAIKLREEISSLKRQLRH
ncbi:uvrABC system protein B [Acidaminococcus sp. CAG:917]|mgnify:CR=1 FL=1|nr:uvrABC system protein B [Acidaminococcus sp. CAG:917]